PRPPPPFPTRRSSDLQSETAMAAAATRTTSVASTSSQRYRASSPPNRPTTQWFPDAPAPLISPAALILTPGGVGPRAADTLRRRSEEHTSELQSRSDL